MIRHTKEYMYGCWLKHFTLVSNYLERHAILYLLIYAKNKFSDAIALMGSHRLPHVVALLAVPSPCSGAGRETELRPVLLWRDEKGPAV